MPSSPARVQEGRGGAWARVGSVYSKSPLIVYSTLAPVPTLTAAWERRARTSSQCHRWLTVCVAKGAGRASDPQQPLEYTLGAAAAALPPRKSAPARPLHPAGSRCGRRWVRRWRPWAVEVGVDCRPCNHPAPPQGGTERTCWSRRSAPSVQRFRSGPRVPGGGSRGQSLRGAPLWCYCGDVIAALGVMS